jgi:hypothetical protein
MINDRRMLIVAAVPRSYYLSCNTGRPAVLLDRVSKA